jgi:hypothetical protein
MMAKEIRLNILEALNYGPTLPDSIQRFVENPKARFQQTDSTGYSLIRVDNGANFHYTKLNIHISSPKYFERRTRLYTSHIANIHSALQALLSMIFFYPPETTKDTMFL